MQVNLEFYGNDGKPYQNFNLDVELNKLATIREEDLFAAPSVPSGTLKFKLNEEEYTFNVDLPMVKSPMLSFGGITLIQMNAPKVSTIGYVNERTLTWNLENNRELVVNFQRFNPDPSLDYVRDQLCVYLFKSMMVRSK